MVKILFSSISIIYFFASSTLLANGIEIKAKTDSTNYLIGDYVNYTVKVISDEKLEDFHYALADSARGMEMLESGKLTTEEADNKFIYEIKYIFSKYDSGSAVIPPLRVFFLGDDKEKAEISSEPVTVNFSTVEVDAQAEIQDIKDPIKIPLDWKTILFFALIGLAILALIIFGIIYYLKKRKGVPKERVKYEKKKPSHEIAFEKLKELETAKLWQQGKVKEYHTQLTEIIRVYLEDRFGISALEMTSSEILEKLNGNSESQKIEKICERFFENADLVKFAKFQPLASVNEDMMKQAFQTVDQTKLVESSQLKEETLNV